MLYIRIIILAVFLVPLWEPPLHAQTRFLNQSELSDTSKLDLTRWAQEGIALKVAFGSTDVRYLRHQVPQPVIGDVKLTAWRGERVNLQMVIWSNRNSYSINIQPSDLEVGTQKIPASTIKAFPVRYVMTDLFLQGCGYRKSDTIASSLAPDMLEYPGTFSIEAKSTRPVWVTIDVPADAKAAIYKGYIEVKAKGRFKKRLHYTLEVLDRTLPKPAEWKFHLDLWQHPWAVARTSSVRPWSSEHWQALKATLTLLASAGQKCITTTLIHDPWGGQTYDPYESMIDWRKAADGSWAYDFALFDQYVSFAMSCGIQEQINCYSMIPWQNSFRYFDEGDNEYKILHALPGTPEFENHWRQFLLAFREHLRSKGWLEKTSIAMDERSLKDMLSMIRLIRSTTPELKIAFAGNYHPEIAEAVYDLCAFITQPLDRTTLISRTIKHWPTTFYVCCSNPEHPNNFTFSPFAENTLMGWFAAANGYNGFLRWAYNSWVKDPEHDSRFRTWPAGDTYLVYPGARSSIRFELLRAGIQDFEKIALLRADFESRGTAEGWDKLNRLNDMLKSFSLSKVQLDSAATLVDHGREVLNELSR